MTVLKQLISAMKVVRPRHFLKAVLHPLEEIRAFKYHYRRVPEREFVAFLSKMATGSHELDRAFDDLKKSGISEYVKRELTLNHSDGYGGEMTRERNVIYALVRLLQPEVMVETGVADGATTSYILQAMEENKKGKLHSIDVPSELLPRGKSSGWMVPDRLRHRWDLRIGKSSDLLKPLLEELGRIDFFLHDSLHTYENMLFEYRMAWPYLRPDGLFLSHDVGSTDAFFDFLDEKDIRWKDWRVHHVLGGFRKNNGIR